MLSQREVTAEALAPFLKYRNDPAGFAADVLGVRWVPNVVKAAESLLTPPYRVLMPSANAQGKTHSLAGISLWWFCTRSPSIVTSTAPKLAQLKNLLWKEIRRQVAAAKMPLPFTFCGPRSIRAERSAFDYMEGTTARDDTSFQGVHGPNKLFIFDEAIGVAPEFWTATATMFKGAGTGDGWICAFNPTDTTTAVYREYQHTTRTKLVTSGWHIVRMAAVDHPNIAAELRGEPPVVPDAMRLGMFDTLLRQWSNLLAPGDMPRATDFQWPFPWATDYIQRTGQQPRWYRPGPLADARLFARFPSQSAYSVWSDGDWQAALRVGLKPLDIPTNTIPEIGCDVARYGDDNTEFHVRCGPCSLAHEAFNGQGLDVTIGTVKRLCKTWAEWANKKRPRPIRPTQVPIKIDDSGVGGGVTDILLSEGYAVAGVNASSLPIETDNYFRRRDELWFHVAVLARDNELDLSRLPQEVIDELQGQAMSVKYKLDSAGRRVVETKDLTKAAIGRSPDGFDAVNLAYCYVEGLDVAGDLPHVTKIRRG